MYTAHVPLLRNPVTEQELEILHSGGETNGELLVMRSTLRPGSVPPAPHFHPAQAEDLEVEKGELTVMLDGRRQLLHAGDTLHMPAGVVHSMWNAGSEVVSFRWETRPALRTEQFLRNAFGLAADGKVSGNGAPTLLQASLLLPHFAAEYRLASVPSWLQRLLFGLLAPIARLRSLKPAYPRYSDVTRP